MIKYGRHHTNYFVVVLIGGEGANKLEQIRQFLRLCFNPFVYIRELE